MTYTRGRRLKAGIGVMLFISLVIGCVPARTPGGELPTAATSIEAVPTSAPHATPTKTGCTETSGSVERIKVPSELLEGGLWISLYKPPCYKVDPATPYPVLYLLHGQGMDDTFWLGLGVADIANRAIVNGQKPLLMVMPFEERNFDPMGDSKFDEALLQELIPWVDGNYPTCTLRECRAIGGISRGGGWAVHLTLRNFDTFGAVGAHSMGLMAGDWWYVGHLLETHNASEFPRIYVDRGEDDYLAEDIDLFESALAFNKIAHEYHVSPGRHEAAYWQAHVADYMQWYMLGWQ
jgi:enterochelin esterase-like enzyme